MSTGKSALLGLLGTLNQFKVALLSPKEGVIKWMMIINDGSIDPYQPNSCGKLKGGETALNSHQLKRGNVKNAAATTSSVGQTML